MPKMQTTSKHLKKIRDKVVCIVCSDIHLSHKPPVFRSNEPDWYEAMDRSLRFLCSLQNNLNRCPVLIAGDIFDKWNPPPELINFALERLPQEKVYAVPGQHDLRNHAIDDMNCTAYGTLVQTGLITDLSIRSDVISHNGMGISVRGFGWNQEPPERKDEFPGITLLHRYVWDNLASYPGAPKTSAVKPIAKQFDSTLLVTGDNHKGFYNLEFNVYNCGGFYRRTADQFDYSPAVGVVYHTDYDPGASLRVLHVPIPQDENVCLPLSVAKAADEVSGRMEDLMQSFREVESADLDFLSLLKEIAISNRRERPALADYLSKVIHES